MNSQNSIPVLTKRETHALLKELKFDMRVDSLDKVIKILIEEHQSSGSNKERGVFYE